MSIAEKLVNLEMLNLRFAGIKTRVNKTFEGLKSLWELCLHHIILNMDFVFVFGTGESVFDKGAVSKYLYT